MLLMWRNMASLPCPAPNHWLPRRLVTLTPRALLLPLPPGSTFLIWFGPTPRLAVADPDLIREILLSRADHFDRYESHPMVRQLEGEGLVSLRGDKWAHRRKVLTPAFHTENLKVSQSVSQPISDAMQQSLLELW